MNAVLPPVGDAVALLAQLVRIDSRNPSLVPGAPGEAAAADLLARTLREWGFTVRLLGGAAGRPNVVAMRPGSGGGRSLILNGHIDVVDVEGMTHSPFDAVVRDGRLYGRGASDMKGGVAAMCAAAARARNVRGDVIVCAVVDEEYRSEGTASLLANGVVADAAIVTEPTGLAIMPAHKGFVWIEAEFTGRAAHGSRWDLGVDAIVNAGLFLAELRALNARLGERSHPLLNRPSIHASTIAGGAGWSTYPDRCVVTIERRTIPGETDDAAMAEIVAICRRLEKSIENFHCTIVQRFAQPPSDVPTNAPIVQCVADVLRASARTTTPRGMSAWTDAALLNAAGIPAICFGPGDMGLAHAAEEYIEIAQVEEATDLLARIIEDWCA